MSNIGELLKKVPEFQKKAEAHDRITEKTLETTAEIYDKITEILTKLEKIEKRLDLFEGKP